MQVKTQLMLRVSDRMPDQLRCAAHTDYGTLTLLLQVDYGGLQVKAKFHYTGQTGPDRTRTDPHGLFRETRAADPGLRRSPCGSARVSDKMSADFVWSGPVGPV